MTIGPNDTDGFPETTDDGRTVLTSDSGPISDDYIWEDPDSGMKEDTETE